MRSAVTSDDARRAALAAALRANLKRRKLAAPPARSAAPATEPEAPASERK